MNYFKTLFAASALLVSGIANAQVIVRVAGNGFCGNTGNGGDARNAEICHPWGLSVDPSGSVYIGDWGNSIVRKVSNTGIISVFAGSGSTTTSGDGGPALTAGIPAPWFIYIDKSGNTYVNQGQVMYRKINSSGIISTVAGSDTAGGYVEGASANTVRLWPCSAMTSDNAGNLYIGQGMFYPFPGDTTHNFIWKVNTSGIITTFAGNGSSTADGVPAINARITDPIGMVTDDAGNLFFSTGAVINKIDNHGVFSRYAGGGSDTANGATIANARIYPTALAMSPNGELYFSEGGRCRIRKISKAGIVSTVVGDGVPGFSGDTAAAATAHVFPVNDLAFDAQGNLYFDVENGPENFAMVFKVILQSQGVPAVNSSNNIAFSPNPSNGVFNLVTGENTAGWQVTVCNYLGQKVYRADMLGSNTSVALYNQPAGVYFAQVVDDKGQIRHTQKLTKL